MAHDVLHAPAPLPLRLQVDLLWAAIDFNKVLDLAIHVHVVVLLVELEVIHGSSPDRRPPPGEWLLLFAPGASVVDVQGEGVRQLSASVKILYKQYR